MSDTTAPTRAPRRAIRKAPNTAATSSPSRTLDASREAVAREIAALLRLADLDAALLARVDERPGGEYETIADERQTLGASLSPVILDVYHRALRGGRQPAVVGLVASVCSGCHMHLHSALEQKIRRRHGVAACPHCLRVVYDPAWLAP